MKLRKPLALVASTLTAYAVACAVSGPAFAIPSPELIVGSVTSVSQLISLLAATIGGGALVVGSRSGAGAGPLRRIALCCGLLALASLAGNAYQFMTARQDARAHLEATLVRPTPKAAKGANGEAETLDPLLREIPYTAQQTHPLGLDARDAETLVDDLIAGRRDDWRIIDIRETAETEAGSLPTAVKIRFPDLPTAAIDLTAKKPLLICHNGNRSAETCAALAAKGIDCRFIRGGLEKWLTEGRPGFGTRGIADLRAIPDYANHQTLLDTEAVKRLVADERAVFVDVRYPGEFAAQHLPGAINLPLRSTPSVEIAARLTSLRMAPVIVPCYDRRSCFFGEILGLMLTRAGADFRGRYTVPWEYFAPPPPPPHVKAFLAQQQRGMLAKASDVAAIGLDRLAQTTGFVLAIALAALLSRLVVLPVSIKAERDQATARRIEPDVADIRTRFAEDPARLGRAMRALYKREGLTPLRNLLALAFLPLMAVLSLAVQTHAERHPQPLLWLGSLADRDPTLVVPLLASALLTVYLQLAFGFDGARRRWLWLIALPMLTASFSLLGAGVVLYIVISALLLLGQRAIVTGSAAAALRAATGWRARARTARFVADGIVPLSADPSLLIGCGNKALHLAKLKAEGLSVPDGVVLTGRFLERFRAMPPAERSRHLDKLWRAIGARRIAVRSSAAAEDGQAHSFAGVFESVLDVDRAGLEAAITRVVASFSSDRVAAYGVDGGTGNVILQRMVGARFAGVLFTRDPVAAGFMLVEMVEGNGEALVSGAATPRTFRYSRLTGSPAMTGDAAPPIDLAPLIAIGRRAETSFGAAQDIEWAYADGRFVVVQSRAIVGAGAATEPGIVHAEWTRVLAGVEAEAPTTVCFAQNEMSEMLPRPTPLSLSLMNDFWASGGSLDLACRRLGLSYRVEDDSAPMLVTILGRLYVDQRQAAHRGPAIAGLDARRLRRAAATIERQLTEQFLPGFLRTIAVSEVADYDRMTLPQLVAELAHRRQRFVTETHAEVDVVNILAQFYLQDASLALRRLGLDPLRFLAPQEETEPQRVARRAASLPPSRREATLMEGFGHRAVLDYELSQPRFRENRTGLEATLLALPMAGNHPHASASAPLPPAIADKVGLAVRYQALKETAKHHALRELAELRRLALALDRRLHLGGHVFQLTLDDLEAADETSADSLRRLALERARRADVLAAVPALPTRLTAADLVGASAGLATAVADSGAISGTRVAGAKRAVGRARTISAADCEQGRPIPDFADGDIIVARMIHPAWIVYFPRAGGLVSELGGWLSHTALLARENDLAMIVAVKDLAAIPDGSAICLEPDGRVTFLVDDAQTLAAE